MSRISRMLFCYVVLVIRCVLFVGHRQGRGLQSFAGGCHGGPVPPDHQADQHSTNQLRAPDRGSAEEAVWHGRQHEQRGPKRRCLPVPAAGQPHGSAPRDGRRARVKLGLQGGAGQADDHRGVTCQTGSKSGEDHLPRDTR